jgi:hypothetical protein
MTHDLIAGAIGGDLWPSGAFVIVIQGSHIETHWGRVAFPPGETYGILYPRCTEAGGFRFVGQAHDVAGVTWEYLNDAWVARGPSNGTQGAIYDLLGGLHLIAPGPGATSQGYRTVVDDGTPAGRLVLGDATLGPRGGLHEYTDLSDAQDGSLLIGQGSVPEGVLVNDAGTLRVLALGPCKWIQARRDREAVAITFRNLVGIVPIQTTRAELRALPVAGAPPPVIDTHPGPIVNAPIPTAQEAPVSAPFDIHTVTFVDNPADLAAWPETAVITSIDLSTGRICVDHTKRSGPSAWPDAPFSDDPKETGTCQYTLGLCLQINGTWYGAAVIQFWQGRELAAGGDVAGIAKDWYYSDRWAPLTGHQPAPGELVGWFVVAGNLRDNTRIGVRERSNIVVIPFGQNYTASAPPPVDKQPGPVVNTPPSAPAPIAPFDDSRILAKLDDVKAAIAQASAADVAKLDEIKVAFITSANELKQELPALLTALAGGGGASALSGILGVLGKKK